MNTLNFIKDLGSLYINSSPPPIISWCLKHYANTEDFTFNYLLKYKADSEYYLTVLSCYFSESAHKTMHYITLLFCQWWAQGSQYEQATCCKRYSVQYYAYLNLLYVSMFYMIFIWFIWEFSDLWNIAHLLISHFY